MKRQEERRHMHRVHGVFALVAIVGAMAASGCQDRAGDCSLNDVPCSSGRTDAGPPVGCVPSTATGAVADSCGVFVSPSGDDGNAGTKEKPVKTIAAGLGKGATVYACAGAMPFSEAVTVPAAATIYGGLDCTSWVYDASNKTQLTAKADAVPLTIGTRGAVEINDFAISATSATKEGGSSIAVQVNGATASFERCDLVAGDAKGGLAGTSGGAQAMQAEGGDAGDNATSTTQNGGAGGVNAVCSLSGGMGGAGGAIQNGPGGNGAPGDNGNGGPNGTGDTGAGCGGPNPNGTNGTTPGFGLGASGIGGLTANGYQGTDGQPGMDGTHGTSGGGGGGSQASTMVHGAGGGGGGAGGCGGTHGEGGKAGGSSLALVSVGATVTMTSCTLKSGKGGDGGAGGGGQFGQFGGLAGLAGAGSGSVADGCNGGKGGKGGDGSDGGGGLGGHSFGIATTGTTLMLDVATKSAITPGVKGTGGQGGNTNENMNPGAGGMAARCWNFAANAACGS
jgi:hypothetical protein